MPSESFMSKHTMIDFLHAFKVYTIDKMQTKNHDKKLHLQTFTQTHQLQ